MFIFLWKIKSYYNMLSKNKQDRILRNKFKILKVGLHFE